MSLRSIIIAVLAVLTLAGAYLSYSSNHDLMEARAKLVSAQETAKVKTALVDSTEAHATVAVQRARKAEARLAVAKSTRDSLANCLDAKDGYKIAYQDQKRATTTLREVVQDYDDASADILDATDESFLESLVPDVRPGAAVGIDPFTQRPAAVVGVTVSWDF